MILSTLRRSFQKHPILANILTTTALFGAADVTCQLIEHEGINKFNIRRTCNLMAVGMFYSGPTMALWYRLLDHKLPGTNPRTIALKLLVDQTIFTIPLLVGFYVCLGTFEGRNWGENKKELRLKFIPTYVTSCMFWPTAQLVNFALVPPLFRVLYISSMTLIWMTCLSYIKNSPTLPTFLVRVSEVSEDLQRKILK